jgi:hypothetical protein
VQVLERDDERLHLAFAEQQALDRVERTLASLGGFKPRPLFVLDRDIEEREQRGDDRLEGAIERQELAGDLLADFPGVVAGLDLEVTAQERDHREVRRRLPVRD